MIRDTSSMNSESLVAQGYSQWMAIRCTRNPDTALAAI